MLTKEWIDELIAGIAANFSTLPFDEFKRTGAYKCLAELRDLLLDFQSQEIAHNDDMKKGGPTIADLIDRDVLKAELKRQGDSASVIWLIDIFDILRAIPSVPLTVEQFNPPLDRCEGCEVASPEHSNHMGHLEK